MYHVHNAVFSRKAIREGKAYCYYYSKNIKTMNDRKSVNKRMKHKLKILRKNQLDLHHFATNHPSGILEFSRLLMMI